MPAAPRRASARRAALLGAMLAVGVPCASCAGSVPVDATCDTTSECETGLQCLYALGAGCASQGRCVVPENDCSGSSAGLVLCGCGGVTVQITCIPSSAALPLRTATGAACLVDGGGVEGGADGGAAASLDGATEAD